MTEQQNNKAKNLAKVRIGKAAGEEAFLKNISVTGCIVEFPTYVNIIPNTCYTLEIMPESASNIAAFDLSVESNWVRQENYSCEIGFSIIESPKGKQFQHYVDFLSWCLQAE